MSVLDRATCRANAAECVELARVATNPATKEILLQHAQEWLRLAYARDELFEELLADFNSRQMNQPQPVQQQQTKIKPSGPGEPDDGIP